MAVGKNPFAKEVNRVLLHMTELEPTSAEYKKAVENLEVLRKAQSYDKDQHLSRDAILASATSIGGIVAILHFEKLGIVTSKAFGLIVKAHL